MQTIFFKSLLLFIIIPVWTLFSCNKSYAQQLQQRWNVVVSQSKVTGDPLDFERFFNSVEIAVQYKRAFAPYIDGVIGVSVLQAMEADGRDGGSPSDQALDRFHKSFINFDAGIVLTPIRFHSSEIHFGLGPVLRRRMQVEPVLATQINNEVLVKDRFTKSWDLGGFTYLEYSTTIYKNWIIGLRAQIRTYTDADSIFGIGLSIGQKF